jgi:hypothetical protein
MNIAPRFAFSSIQDDGCARLAGSYAHKLAYIVMYYDKISKRNKN